MIDTKVYERVATMITLIHDPMTDDEIRELGYEPTENGWELRNPARERASVQHPEPVTTPDPKVLNPAEERAPAREPVSTTRTPRAPRTARAKRPSR